VAYSVAEIRRWDAGGLATAGTAVAERLDRVESVRRTLTEGRDALDDGWDGRAAEAVLAAAEGERSHTNGLIDGFDDLAAALTSAEQALRPAVQVVNDRIAAAEAAGLVVRGDSIAPASGAADTEQSVVDEHAEALSQAVDTVASLDLHYGREIDAIAARLHAVIPPEVDRGVIPGPDDPWPGRGVDAMTGAMSERFPKFADELDPATRGRHALVTAPDDVARSAASGLRGLGRVAGPLGAGITVYDGLEGYAKGETSKGEAVMETSGALGGGVVGGMAAGAAVGTFLGPVGTIVGVGIGAAVGAYLGQKGMDELHDAAFR